MTAVLFSASSLSFFSINTITYIPLQLAWWNFTWTCTLTTSRSLSVFNTFNKVFNKVSHILIILYNTKQWATNLQDHVTLLLHLRLLSRLFLSSLSCLCLRLQRLSAVYPLTGWASAEVHFHPWKSEINSNPEHFIDLFNTQLHTKHIRNTT